LGNCCATLLLSRGISEQPELPEMVHDVPVFKPVPIVARQWAERWMQTRGIRIFFPIPEK
jgi:hypothetical protein